LIDYCGKAALGIEVEELASAAGEADSELDTKHEGAVAIFVILDPEFGAGRSWRGFAEKAVVADLARDARVGELFANLCNFGAVRREKQ